MADGISAVERRGFRASNGTSAGYSIIERLGPDEPGHEPYDVLFLHTDRKTLHGFYAT